MLLHEPANPLQSPLRDGMNGRADWMTALLRRTGTPSGSIARSTSSLMIGTPVSRSRLHTISVSLVTGRLPPHTSPNKDKETAETG